MEANAVLRALVATGTFACACCARADNLPGDYFPRPAGTAIAGVRYSYAEGGDLYARGEQVDGDFHYQDEQVMLNLNYYAGQSLRWGLLAQLPMGHTEAASDRLHLKSSDSGLGDASIIVGVWPLIGQNYHLAFSGWLFAPTGSYDAARVVNQGLNVWSAKLEGNFNWRPSPSWSLELTSAVRVFDDNEDFGPAHRTLERAPRYTVETHVVRTLRETLFLSLDYFYHCGSETTVNGVERDDDWDDHAAQLSVSWRFSQKQMLTVWYRDDFKVRSGPEFQTVGIRLMQRVAAAH
jgi:hypothetical protein